MKRRGEEGRRRKGERKEKEVERGGEEGNRRTGERREQEVERRGEEYGPEERTGRGRQAGKAHRVLPVAHADLVEDVTERVRDDAGVTVSALHRV